MIGTTIETNRNFKDTKAPSPEKRYVGMMSFKGQKTFLTVEPIMQFDVDCLSKWIIDIKPSFVNIGADSKGCGLAEPSTEKILSLIDKLNKNKIKIKKKTNLGRLLLKKGEKR